MARNHNDHDNAHDTPLDQMLPFVHIPAGKEEGEEGTFYWDDFPDQHETLQGHAGISMAQNLIDVMRDRDDPDLLLSVLRDMMVGRATSVIDNDEADAHIREVQFSTLERGFLLVLACALIEKQIRWPNARLGF